MARKRILAGRLVMTGIVIVAYRNTELVLKCLRSIDEHLATMPRNVVVVNNAPGDGAATAIAEAHPAVTVIEAPRNEGFAAGCNRGAAATPAACRYLLFLNPDTELRDGSLATLVEYLESHGEVAIAGSRLLNEDGSTQPSVRRFPTLGNLLFSRRSPIARFFPGNPWTRRYHHADVPTGQSTPVDSVGGAVMLVRRNAFDELGGFDESFFLYVEDTDLCYRARQLKWESHYVPSATVYHRRGSSAALHRRASWLEHQRGILRFLTKHRLVSRTAGCLLDMLLRIEAALLGFPRLRVLWFLFLLGCGGPKTPPALLSTTATQQEQLGEHFGAALGRELRFLRDPRISNTVDRVGRTVARASAKPNLHYRFYIVDNDREVLAYSIPGGGIYIHTALLRQLKSEAELAAVLAHEIVHIARGHGTEQVRRHVEPTFFQELVNGMHREFWARHARAAATPAGPMPLTDYGRKNEYGADRVASTYTLRAGWDPYAMIGLLEGLDELERRAPSRVQRWLSPHPPTRERIRRIQEELGRRNLPSGLMVGSAEYSELLDHLD